MCRLMRRPFFLATLEIAGYRFLLLSSVGLSAAFTADSLATGWLVLQLTDSPFWLGLVVGVRGVSQLLFSIGGGTIADRTDLRRLLMWSQQANALLYVLLCALVITGTVQIWFVVVAQVVIGPFVAMNGLANQALLYEVVGPARLLNARALGFLTSSTMRILAALATGHIIESWGVGPAYAFVAAAYFGSSLCLLPLPSRGVIHPVGAPLDSLRAGLRYARRTDRVRELLLLSFTTEVFGFSHTNMVPVMARDVLRVGADGLGYLSAMSAAGQLAAMLLLASLGDPRRKEVLLLVSAFGYGAAILLFAVSPWFAVSLALMLLVGATAGLYDSSIVTVLQMAVSDEMRARVLGIYVATWGSNQVGSFGLGALAAIFGAPAAIAAFAVVVAANALRLVPKRNLFDHAVT